MSAPISLLGAHHVALITSRFELLRQFYVDLLGLPVVGGFVGEDILFIDAGGTVIELTGETTADRPSGAGWRHLAFEVASVDEAVAALAALGVVFHVPPEDFPPAAPSMRIAFFRDPDGNVLELVQPLGARYPSLE